MSSSPHRQTTVKKYAQVGLIVFVLLALCLLAIRYFDDMLLLIAPQRFNTQHAMGAYPNRPLVMSDAFDLCMNEARQRHPKQLLTIIADQLSSRYESRQGEYLVALDIQVGGGHSQRSAKVLCTIDPALQQLTYYNETFEDSQSLMARGVKFLANKFGFSD